jgi:hypothetical protein
MLVTERTELEGGYLCHYRSPFENVKIACARGIFIKFQNSMFCYNLL